MGERPRLVIDLASDPQLARDLSAGGVLVPGCELAITEECTLVVRGEAHELELAARVVYLDPQRGAGLELIGFGPAMKDQLAKLVGGEGLPPARSQPSPTIETSPATSAPRQGLLVDDQVAPDEATIDAAVDVDADADADNREAEDKDPVRQERAQTIHQKLRNLSFAEQIKAAHSGDPQERMILERMYGKNVWEALLRNSRVTAPEVARIARMGALPRPLIEVIVANGAWLQIAEVRRALLNNPRLGTDQVLRVLRVMSKPELRLASVQKSYSTAVREAAKRLIKASLGERPS